MNADGVDEACKSHEVGTRFYLVAEGLVIHEKPASYLGITAGNGR